MSFTLSINGNKSELNTNYFPPLTLNKKYECGLLYFSALNSVPNINNENNVFMYGNEGKQIIIPCGLYDLQDINDYVKTRVQDCDIQIKANNNTLKCSIFCSQCINFEVKNSIAPLLGFPPVKLEANKWHESMNPVSILPLTVIRIECDLVQGSYINGSPSHIIYEFVPNVAPGYQFIEVPRNVIYFPLRKKIITSVSIKIVDSEGNLINFQNENIQLCLHLRESK